MRPYLSDEVSTTTTTGLLAASHASRIRVAMAFVSVNGAVTKKTSTMSTPSSRSSVSAAAW